MKNNYTLRYLPAAFDDLIAIFDWIAAGNPTNASDFVAKIDQPIGSLKAHPYLGRKPHDDKLASAGYRVVIESYLFYITRGKKVEIHRIIHGSRNLCDLIGA